MALAPVLRGQGGAMLGTFLRSEATEDRQMWPKWPRRAMVFGAEYFVSAQSDEADLFSGLTAFNPAAFGSSS